MTRDRGVWLEGKCSNNNNNNNNSNNNFGTLHRLFFLFFGRVPNAAPVLVSISNRLVLFFSFFTFSLPKINNAMERK